MFPFPPVIRTPRLEDASSVVFDGTNDYMKRGAGLTGAADSKQVTLCFWINNAADGVLYRFFNEHDTLGGTAAQVMFRVNKTTGNAIQVVGENSAGTIILNVTSANNTVETGDGWCPVLFSCDLSDSNKRHFYIKGADAGATWTTYTDDTMDFTGADWSVGGPADGGADKLNASLAELFFHNTYIDLSNVQNRRTFVNGVGKPANLGSTGSRPLGVQPLIYLRHVSGAGATDFATNLGSGGNFSITGTLVEGTVPSF